MTFCIYLLAAKVERQASRSPLPADSHLWKNCFDQAYIALFYKTRLGYIA